MLENCKTAKERWGGVNEIIDRWLQERQELLVDYCSLSDIRDFDESNGEHTEKTRKFCQILVDYISAGHFEVYEQLVKEGEDFDDQQALETAAQLYKVIDYTTEKLMDFNDKYQETDDLSALITDLSLAGEQLVSRFEAEDFMIEVLHTSHKDLVVE